MSLYLREIFGDDAAIDTADGISSGWHGKLGADAYNPFGKALSLGVFQSGSDAVKGFIWDLRYKKIMSVAELCVVESSRNWKTPFVFMQPRERDVLSGDLRYIQKFHFAEALQSRARRRYRRTSGRTRRMLSSEAGLWWG